MLRPSLKKRNRFNGKIINQKIKFRNHQNNSTPLKASNSTNNNINEQIDKASPRTNTFLYNIQKRKKLNELKEKSHKVSVFMNNLEESLHTFNRNINSKSNPLMISNLTKISFRRSVFIRNKLRNIDKLNKEFDREYNNYINLNPDNKYKYKQKNLKIINEIEEDRIEKEKKLRDENFKEESVKIFKLLFKKDDQEELLSDYKKNKKLNELKSSIDYVCGVEEKGQYGNNQNESGKIPHYTIPAKSPSFIREKSKNASFTPTVKYNKAKVYFSKKYELSQDKIIQSKKYIEKINKTIQVSPKEKPRQKLKGRKIIFKNEQNKTDYEFNIFSPIKKNNQQLFFENNSKKDYIILTSENNIHDKKNNYQLPRIKIKEYNKNNYKTLSKRNMNLITFSPKQRHSSLGNNLFLPRKNSSSAKYLYRRLKTANKTSCFKSSTIENKNSINSKGKKFYPILKSLLKENYNLKNDLKLGFNIITNMINDFKNNPKKKVNKSELNIEKLRKELNLNNINNMVDEIDVVMNNVKKMEKLIKKKDIYFLRRVAKTVIREDKLANKNLVFDNNSINAKLKKIYDRKNKINNQEEIEENLDELERKEMIRLFKNDGPDFFSEEYLSDLIKRYKTMKVK